MGALLRDTLMLLLTFIHWLEAAMEPESPDMPSPWIFINIIISCERHVNESGVLTFEMPGILVCKWWMYVQFLHFLFIRRLHDGLLTWPSVFSGFLGTDLCRLWEIGPPCSRQPYLCVEVLDSVHFIWLYESHIKDYLTYKSSWCIRIQRCFLPKEP